MSESIDEFGLDPWAWLHEIDDEEDPDLSGFHVIAVMPAAGGDPRRCAQAIQEQSVAVASIVTDLRADQQGDWLWIVPDDVVPEPDALATALRRVLARREASVVGCLLVEPRRRGAGKMISDWAQTISGNGRMHTLTEPGELYQGQLLAVRALGVPAAGMLVRGDTWRFLGGFNTMLPRNYWGLDFGWRANLTGYEVIAEPDAHITNYASFDDPGADHAAGLALTVAHAKPVWRWLVTLRLAVATFFVALGYLLGKDVARSREEFDGLWQWMRNSDLRRTLNRELASLPTKPASVADTRQLRPAPGSGIRRAAALTAARFAGWLETFSGRGDAATFDEMTGDDFAEVSDRRARVPLAATAAVALVVAALLASRNSYGEGLLTASQLMPSPDSWSTLVNAYLRPVPGGAGSGTPWAALVGLVSLLTIGHPDWLVTIVVVLAVPLTWLLAFRLARHMVADRYLAGVGALAYALSPAILGGLNAGALGVSATAVLLPLLGYSARTWLTEDRWSWRAAGSVAFWMLLLCALVPLFWLPALVLAIVIGVRAADPRVWAQLGLVVGAPLLLLIGPWAEMLWRYPGRLLTGIEPSLSTGGVVPAWELFLGHPLEQSAPLWLAAGFFAACWLAAVLGAVRRPSPAVPALGVAVCASVVALVITRFPLQVPPGVWARPDGVEWLVLVTAGLIVAAISGLDGVLGELSSQALGLRHFGLLGLAVLACAALVTGTGWWVIGGQTGLGRASAATVPAFVHDAQVSTTPGRTLALAAGDGTVRWALVEGNFARLGDSERGLAFGGNQDARALAASVVMRLVGDSADDQILPDLVRLGVSHITLSGGEASQRISISNTPGLGAGTGTDQQFVWSVPDSGIAVVSSGDDRVLVGNGVEVPAGGSDRLLQLAEPSDPNWVVTVGGQQLQPGPAQSPGTDFTLGSASGTLRYHLAAFPPWWAWIQFAGLLILAILAAPSVRRRTPAEPRRMAGGEL